MSERQLETATKTPLELGAFAYLNRLLEGFTEIIAFAQVRALCIPLIRS